MLVFACSLLLQKGQVTSFDIGAGLVAVVSPDATQRSYEAGSVLDIRRGSATVAHVSMRSLIVSWLESDAFWGGHTNANNMRYADHPTSDARACLQGYVYEVVSAPGGCLVRMGIVNTSPSAKIVNPDFVLRWQSRSPNLWPVFDRSAAGNSSSTKTIKLPRFRGIQYLVSGYSVYRLSGPNLKKNLITTLPPSEDRGWVGIRLTGSKLVVEMPDVGDEPGYRVVDLATGKTTSPALTSLKSSGIPVYIAPPETKLPQFYNGQGMEAVRRHSAANWQRYIKIASNQRASDADRADAVTDFIYLVASFGHGPWTADAIRATYDAIRTGPYLVQLAAIRSVCAWILNWPRQVRGWSPAEVALVRKILADPTFQRIVCARASAGDSGMSSSEDEAGVEFGPQWGPPSFGEVSEEVRDQYRIKLATYVPALAISRSPKALPFLKSKIGSGGRVAPVYIQSLGFLPRNQVEGYLYKLAERFYHPKRLGNIANASDAQGAFNSIAVALARAGVTRFDALLPMTKDKKIDYRVRSAMLQALGYFADDHVRARLVEVALDESEPLAFRREAIFTFPRCPGSNAKDDVARIERALPAGELKTVAEGELKHWSIRNEGDSMRRWWGLDR
ncbi:MAG: hypothetical protein ACHQ50_14410 [Fimbriimonadales bacterium]